MNYGQLGDLLLVLLLVAEIVLLVVFLWLGHRERKRTMEIIASREKRTMVRQQGSRLPPDVQLQVNTFLAEMDRDLQRS